MQKYIYGDVLIYAVDHTIKEVQEFFCFPSYQACKRYLLEHHIKHLYECRNRLEKAFEKIKASNLSVEQLENILKIVKE